MLAAFQIRIFPGAAEVLSGNVRGDAPGWCDSDVFLFMLPVFD